MQPTCRRQWSHENIPGNMGAGIDEHRLKVFGELWAFLLAVLDDIISQIKERQLPAAFSWKTYETSPFIIRLNINKENLLSAPSVSHIQTI